MLRDTDIMHTSNYLETSTGYFSRERIDFRTTTRSSALFLQIGRNFRRAELENFNPRKQIPNLLKAKGVEVGVVPFCAPENVGLHKIQQPFLRAHIFCTFHFPINNKMKRHY